MTGSQPFELHLPMFHHKDVVHPRLERERSRSRKTFFGTGGQIERHAMSRAFLGSDATCNWMPQTQNPLPFGLPTANITECSSTCAAIAPLYVTTSSLARIAFA